MDWNALGAIAETLGAIAVVGSIIYLAIQVNNNTKTLKANAGFQATHSWAAHNEHTQVLPDEILELALRAYDPKETWEGFSPVERMRIGVGTRALLQELEGQYFLFKYGELDEELWEARRSWAAGLIQLPFFLAWWKVEKAHKVYTDQFVMQIETAEAVNVDSTVLGGDVS